MVIAPTATLPSAIEIAPVSVATSMMAVGDCSRAKVMPSARMRRPSASVLITSIVLPLIARRTSPGFVALPPGMFSVAGTIAVTSMAGFSRAMAPMVATTAAPPDISPFISSMPAAGLIEMPPVSKVMPLPTSARCVGPPPR